jgi:FAD-dependent urate hydroxylase
MVRIVPPKGEALVIGGGIAGTALALFLQRAGYSPIVYEARPAPTDEAGAFLSLAPNGMAILADLGLNGAVSDAGHPTSLISFLNHQGSVIGALPEQLLTVKRGALNRVLREAVFEAQIPVIFGKRLVDIDASADLGASVTFADGSVAHGDVVIGCDGIHSQTRRALLSEAPRPVYTGIVDSGGFAHGLGLAPSEGEMRMTFGKQGFFGYQVMSSGEVYWFENVGGPCEQSEAVTVDEWKQKLVTLHRDDHSPIADVIDGTDQTIGRWPIHELPSLTTWHRGRAGLIGDAAHATSPHVGQGASLALEDAAVLAKCLRDVPDPAQAFALFEHLRKGRVERIAREARRTGNRKIAGNPVSRKVRDLLLPRFLEMGAKNVEHSYSYRVDWTSPLPGLSTELRKPAVAMA